MRPRPRAMNSGSAMRPSPAEHRLRRFDHDLESQRPGRDLVRRLERVARVGERRHLIGRRDLRQRDDEVRRQRCRRSVRRASRETARSVRRPRRFGLVAEVLDADADGGRQRAAPSCRRRPAPPPSSRRASSSSSGRRAEAVFEVDAVVLDRLALELVDDARVDARRQSRGRGRARSRAWRRPARTRAALRSAIAPSFAVVSAANRCAPP